MLYRTLRLFVHNMSLSSRLLIGDSAVFEPPKLAGIYSGHDIDQHAPISTGFRKNNPSKMIER